MSSFHIEKRLRKTRETAKWAARTVDISLPIRALFENHASPSSQPDGAIRPCGSAYILRISTGVCINQQTIGQVHRNMLNGESDRLAFIIRVVGGINCRWSTLRKPVRKIAIREIWPKHKVKDNGLGRWKEKVGSANHRHVSQIRNPHIIPIYHQLWVERVNCIHLHWAQVTFFTQRLAFAL